MLGFDRITSDPNILGGKACIRGMRISVSLVINLVANRMTVEEILDEYPDLEAEEHTAGPKVRCLGRGGHCVHPSASRSMKFLVDMGLARSTVAFLRTQGYDAIHLREEGLRRLEDHEIVEKARVEGRVILTHDLDFGRVVALSEKHLPSQPPCFQTPNPRPNGCR